MIYESKRHIWDKNLDFSNGREVRRFPLSKKFIECYREKP